MDTENIHITINLDALLGELQHSLQFTINLVAFSLQTEHSTIQDELRLPIENITTIFSKRLQWSNEEASEYQRIWVLTNGLRDIVEGVNLFIESAHKVLSVWSLIDRQNVGEQLNSVIWQKEMQGTAFHRLGLPDKLEHLYKEHNISLDKDLARHLLSINTARNCLVHRRGIVSNRDTNIDGMLCVEWRKLHTFLKDEDGERELIFGKRLEKESTLCARVVDDKKIFAVGEQLTFTVQEFSDVTWGLFAFGSNLVQEISARGINKGFIKPNPEAAQPDNQADG